MPSPKMLIVCLAVILLGWGGGGCVPPGASGQDEESDPDFRVGINRKKSGNFGRAIESFERALHRNPQSASAHFELGLIYFQDVTNYVAAIYHFDRVQRLRPGFGRIDVVRELIKVCKQELVRDAMRGFTAQMQQEMERLDRTQQENTALRQEVALLRAQLNLGTAKTVPRPSQSAKAGGGTVAPPERGSPLRPQLVSPDDGRSPPTPGGMRSYRVQAGDTLYSIARRNDLSAAALRAANPGVIPTEMRTGEEIRIPIR